MSGGAGGKPCVSGDTHWRIWKCRRLAVGIFSCRRQAVRCCGYLGVLETSTVYLEVAGSKAVCIWRYLKRIWMCRRQAVGI